MVKQNYQALATEVLELGEQLFDLVLVEQTTSDLSINIENPESHTALTSEANTGELRIAVDEFFLALRSLLGLQQS